VFIGELILNPSANVGEKLIRELGEWERFNSIISYITDVD
jgi:hypothetical protein